MKYSPEENSFLLAMAAVDQMVLGGLEYLVASPGFRNSPLLLAARNNPNIKIVTVVEERGAAFFALGLARSGKSTALLCTSGTAVANYFPAIMEAFSSVCSLLVITADRPLELIGTGANQCTDQSKVFGSHVRYFAEIAGFEGDLQEEHARFVIGKAMASARAPCPGPVHVNIRFREPFLPSADQVEKIFLAKKNAKPALPWAFISSEVGPSAPQWLAVNEMLKASKRPLLLLGAGNYPVKWLKSLVDLHEGSGLPILAENASGLPLFSGAVPSQVDAVLGEMERGYCAPPDLILRVGAPLTGRALGRLLKAFPIPQLIFSDFTQTQEPHLSPAIFVEGGTEKWLERFKLENLNFSCGEWRNDISKISKKSADAVHQRVANFPLTEWFFHTKLAERVGAETVLFLGNSMPIRDFNSAFQNRSNGARIFSNRGLSGIDGLIATAMGVALGSASSTHAILGDLSTLHDLSSLAIANEISREIRLTLWVMNNGGGEIFRIVQTAKAGGKEEWFTTPQAFDLSALAKGFQIPYRKVTSKEELEAIHASDLLGRGVRIIEVFPDPEANLVVRREGKP